MPLNQEFYNKIAEQMEQQNKLFFKFQNADCGCVETFGYCACENKERACRFVSHQIRNEEYFTPEQREVLISETVYQAEGSYNREEVANVSDIRLAALWLETASDYVKSQLG